MVVILALAKVVEKRLEKPFGGSTGGWQKVLNI
jgi:hypothetical protein